MPYRTPRHAGEESEPLRAIVSHNDDFYNRGRFVNERPADASILANDSPAMEEQASGVAGSPSWEGGLANEGRLNGRLSKTLNHRYVLIMELRNSVSLN